MKCVPSLRAELLKDKVIVTFQNVSKVFVDYYKIDLELFFSLNPFSLSIKE